ncbi:hypothetical protein Tco_0080064 [Tanacetum coccineum]
MHHHNGPYIMFGDMNAVRNAQERFGTTLNSIEADHFNSFIDSTDVTIRLLDVRITGLMVMKGMEIPTSSVHSTKKSQNQWNSSSRYTGLCSYPSSSHALTAWIEKTRNGQVTLGGNSQEGRLGIVGSSKISVMPNGANSSFFTLIPKVNKPTLITDFALICAMEQSTFIVGRQILDGPVILSEIIECPNTRQGLISLNGDSDSGCGYGGDSGGRRRVVG